MPKITRVKQLIEFLEQYPDDSLITIAKDCRLELANVIYLEKRNTIVFLPYVKQETKKKNTQPDN